MYHWKYAMFSTKWISWFMSNLYKKSWTASIAVKSPVSTVFWPMRFRNIRGIEQIGNWFSTVYSYNLFIWFEKCYSIFSVLVEFWFDVFKEVVAEIITETISPALGIDGAVSFARKLENSGLIQTITNLLHKFVLSTTNP